MKNIAVVIPALDPDERLIAYCKSLSQYHGGTIVVVDDGSDEAHQYIFSEIEKLDKCVVLHHPTNLGKGRALKNAFSFVTGAPMTEGVKVSEGGELINFFGLKGVVTADSDGQHAIADVIKLSEELLYGRKELVLGARDFDSDNVPPKSKSGNKITRWLFKLLYHVKLTDTQTGLRGIPAELLPEYIQCRGERFEYELDMLIKTSRSKTPILEIPIETIYENQNEGTHFRTVLDSAAIYRVLLGSFVMYTLSSVSSFVIDILFFQILIMLFMGLEADRRIYLATILARIVSSIYNYLINRRLVFGKDDHGFATAVGYYILVVVQMWCSATMVYHVHTLFAMPEAASKVIVDMLLFLVSYQIQKHIIFRNK